MYSNIISQSRCISYKDS